MNYKEEESAVNIFKLNSESARAFLNKISSRQADMEDKVLDAVREIINKVRQNGDNALISYAKQFDNVELKSLEVSSIELSEAEQKIDKAVKKAIDKAYENIWEFQSAQKPEDFIYEKEGIISKTRYIPIETAGIYVPGGKAAYPSSVLMNAIPARTAGVKNIIMTVPCDENGGINPEVLYAAKLCKVDRIFKVGGAQAIAALAYGTESIPKVDIITGPGNIYVSVAKKLVYGAVNVDMIAGPSEILIVSDGNQNPSYIAADLISQAEHDELASSILLTLSDKEAEAVSNEVGVQLSKLPKSKIASEAIKNYGAILVCDTKEELVDIANQIAPEHLEVLFEYKKITDSLTNAGCIFSGEYSPEPLGDYMAGPNHILPTNGSARAFSPLGIQSFMKRSNYIEASKEGLEKIYKDVACFAKAENLDGHANSILRRFSDDE